VLFLLTGWRASFNEETRAALVRPGQQRKEPMATIETTVVAADKAPVQSTGNRLKFKLEFMFMMLAAGRDKEAAEAYNQLVAEFDKLA
jgi:hypothetical protein